MLSFFANLAADKLNESKFVGNVPHGKAYNQGLSTSNLDIDSGRYAPRAVAQINVETYGSQNSPLINHDIVIRGNFEGVRFTQETQNNLALNNGVVVINPVVSSKTSNALLYQGYAVVDGDL